MQALVKQQEGPGIDYTDWPDAELHKATDVLVQVAYCAVSADDVKTWVWSDWAANDRLLRLPAILGREASGVVAAVGEAVTTVKPGERVAIDPILPCGLCRYCRGGRHNLCSDRQFLGRERGAFAEYVVVPEQAVGRLPDDVTLREGALLAEVGQAVHAVEMAAPPAGGWGLVVGALPLGIMAAQALHAFGLNVAVTDLLAARLEMAGQATKAVVLDVRQEEPQRTIAGLTDGRGVDVVIETMGTQYGLDQALRMVGAGGAVVLTSNYNKPLEIKVWNDLVRREVALLSALGRTWQSWETVLQFLRSGKLELAKLIGTALPLSDYETAFQIVRTGAATKILLYPGDDIEKPASKEGE